MKNGFLQWEQVEGVISKLIENIHYDLDNKLQEESGDAASDSIYKLSIIRQTLELVRKELKYLTEE